MNGTDLHGKIDLLYVDNKGTVHVVDFKFMKYKDDSINQYRDKSFKYQLAYYKRILQTKGISANNISLELITIPYLLENDKALDKDTEFKITNLDSSNINKPSVVVDASAIESEVEKDIPIVKNKVVVNTDYFANSQETTKKMFGEIPYKKFILELSLEKAIKSRIVFKHNKYFIHGTSGIGGFVTKEEAIEKLKDVLKQESDQITGLFSVIKTTLNNNLGKFNTESLNFLGSLNKESLTHVNNLLTIHLSKYVNEDG